MNEYPVNVSDHTETRSVKERLKKLLAKNYSLHSICENYVGYIDRVIRGIPLTDETPINQPYRRIPPAFFQ